MCFHFSFFKFMEMFNNERHLSIELYSNEMGSNLVKILESQKWLR